MIPSWSEYKKFRYYHCIQTKTIAFHSFVRKHYFRHLLPSWIEITYTLTSYADVHRFWHNFQYCLNPLGACSLETENTSHYLLHCHYNFTFLIDLTNSVKTFAANFESLSDSREVESYLYGNSRHDDDKNNSIMSASIYYIKNTKRFDCSLCHRFFI